MCVDLMFGLLFLVAMLNVFLCSVFLRKPKRRKQRDQLFAFRQLFGDRKIGGRK